MAFTRFHPEATPTARIGLGLAAVGRPGYLNLGRADDLPADRTPEALRERSHQLLDAAFTQGVRYLDAARSYGRAEEFLADWLTSRADAAKEVVVGSKWGYTYTADWRVEADVHEVKDHSAATLDRQYAESTALLGDRLDLYQIHSVTPDSPALTDPAVHARLARLVEDGVTVGVSTSGPSQAEAIRAALEVTVAGEPLFTTVQATFNVLEPSAAPALAEAHEAGRTVIVKEALANGRLAGRAAPPELLRLAAEADTSPDAFALAAVLAQPWVGLVLSGAATVAQLTDNLAAARLTTDPARLTSLARLVERPESYWRTRAALPWR
ncbi:aldo/keto reductase [Streptomyces sp. 3MP-14]|uniref:Aldo/keto reductase n=1 Tax=Streptomyces mimosae TaxID=2586635 RepID=A0A5N6A572_9ACTN|nr:MULTISPECIES: aldo/keto reductase [Streptomyces]KAB8162548.1 aldo/keto reductase [Streptomyces mimosae]KAB8174375.1 aldo/keto reductase [Streptomyces sp. 3MP-14]